MYESIRDLKILYVEDDSTMRKMFKEVLKKIVDTIYLANDGKDGLDVFEHEDIDIIITDINMPVMSGLEMAYEIRKSDKNIPIVVTSSYSESNYLLQAIDHDVTSYMLKPISYETLRKKIEQVAHSVFLEKRLARNQKMAQTAIDLYEGMIVEVVNKNIDFANESCKRILNINEKPSYKEFSNFFDSEDIIATIQAIEEKNKIIQSKNGLSYLVDMTGMDQNSYLLIMSDVTHMVEKTDQLEKQSVTDELTGIYNRKKFDQSLVYFKESFLRYNISFSVILFDIDHFKHINDTYGHAAGDEALKTLSYIVNNSIRVTDVFARWGGEEFVVLLPETDRANATIVATNLKNLIKIHRFAQIGNITCSFGVGEYGGNESLDDFFKRIDKALYSAKKGGRDQVVVAD
ncbi:MAG: diguanylate cyclase [Campylobacterota bacterium]